MSRVLLMMFALLFTDGCGGESGSNQGAAGSGGSGTPTGLASLGIDPLGRGDGIDITESNYTGRCYEDDELEANRPMLPDPRQVAADEAEATARASQADAAREALALAKDAFDSAQAAYDAALTQSIADSNALLEAWLAIDAPSELPPCDSEELRQSLADAFCTGAFVNPITPEEEAEIPGITASLDAYVARVYAAVG